MAGLDDLERRIRVQLAVSAEREHLEQDDLARGLHEQEERLGRYTAVADRLMQAVIRPRMEKLAGLFENARAPEDQNSRHGCAYRFEHTQRFPATATFALSVTRDREGRTVEVRANQAILPAFLLLRGQDQLAMPVDGVDEEKVAAWADEKIVAFVGAYLRLETADQYQAENAASGEACRATTQT